MLNFIDMKRLILFSLLALCAASCVTGRYKRSAPLRKGDTIGVVGLSSRVSPETDTAALRRVIDSLGFRLLYGEHLLDQYDPSFGADDRTRGKELMRMVESRDVKAILFQRGGYGAVRTLDYIDWRRVRRNPKWIAGYSDVTMIHLAAQRNRIETLHSDMPTSFDGDSLSLTSLVAGLSCRLDTIRIAPHPLNHPGLAQGRLVGGNLSILYAATGTPEEKVLKKRGNILFIEEVGEKLYHIDRMMQNLERSGILAKCSALAVGYMTQITGLERFGVASAEELIARYAAKYGIPAVFGVPAGHQHPNVPLYLGRRVAVEVTKEGTTLVFRP